MNIGKVAAHSSVKVSIMAGLILSAGSVVRPAPWWLWGTWAALSAIAVAQAIRDE